MLKSVYAIILVVQLVTLNVLNTYYWGNLISIMWIVKYFSMKTSEVYKLSNFICTNIEIKISYDAYLNV